MGKDSGWLAFDEVPQGQTSSGSHGPDMCLILALQYLAVAVTVLLVGIRFAGRMIRRSG